MHYQEPFYITGQRGNNAFSYEMRGENPRIRVAAVKKGGLEDLRIATESAFEDVDEFDVLQRCPGLELFVKMDWNGVPMVVFDNHNHAFYFWYEALEQGILKPGSTLIHVDQHKDMRRPEEPWFGGDLQAVFDYNNFKLNVGNYIVPAMDAGLIGQMKSVTGESDMEGEEFLEEENKIINLDLDFFAPDLDYISFEKTKIFLQKHLKTAKLVTVSTSPFFIEQGLAIEKMRALIA